MSRTIHYYNCFIRYNGRRTNLDFSQFIDAIMRLDPAAKYKDLRSGQMSMVGMAEPTLDIPERTTNRRIAIGKYRDHKPYTGRRGTDAAAQIRDDVLEITPVVFLPVSRLVLMDYNHAGARPKHVVEYLNSFLPKVEGQYWEIDLLPLEPERGFADLAASTDIRSVEFKLNLINTPIRNPDLNRQEERPESLLLDIFYRAAASRTTFGANSATLTFSNGRRRRDVISPTDLVPLIANLDFESDLYESVKVRYKSPQTGNVEYLDLKNNDIYKRFVVPLPLPEPVLDEDLIRAWDNTAQAMEADFYANGRPKANEHTHYDLVPERMPALVFAQNDEGNEDQGA
ncbi:hypothetical protein [Paenibacillus sp. Marseille-Q9583]